MTIVFETTLPDMILEVARIGNGPGPFTIAALENVLQESFDYSLAIVPVDTGSLRNSGMTESDFNGEEWTGVLSYGGPSPGAVYDPVEYAHHVKNYYAPNDWLTVTAEAMEAQYQAAVNTHWNDSF